MPQTRRTRGGCFDQRSGSLAPVQSVRTLSADFPPDSSLRGQQGRTEQPTQATPPPARKRGRPAALPDEPIVQLSFSVYERDKENFRSIATHLGLSLVDTLRFLISQYRESRRRAAEVATVQGGLHLQYRVASTNSRSPKKMKSAGSSADDRPGPSGIAGPRPLFPIQKSDVAHPEWADVTINSNADDLDDNALADDQSCCTSSSDEDYDDDDDDDEDEDDEEDNLQAAQLPPANTSFNVDTEQPLVAATKQQQAVQSEGRQIQQQATPVVGDVCPDTDTDIVPTQCPH